MLLLVIVQVNAPWETKIIYLIHLMYFCLMYLMHLMLIQAYFWNCSHKKPLNIKSTLKFVLLELVLHNCDRNMGQPNPHYCSPQQSSMLINIKTFHLHIALNTHPSISISSFSSTIEAYDLFHIIKTTVIRLMWNEYTSKAC